MGHFDWRFASLDHWLTDASDPTGNPAYVLLAVAQTIAFLGAIVTRLLADAVSDSASASYQFACRLAFALGMLGASGLVVLLFRWQPTPVLSMRLWLLLWWISVVAALVRAGAEMRAAKSGRVMDGGAHRAQTTDAARATA